MASTGSGIQDLFGMAQERSKVGEGIGAHEFTGRNEAHEEVPYEPLREIRPVILAEPFFCQALSSLAFEVKGGRIEEDQIESGDRCRSP